MNRWIAVGLIAGAAVGGCADPRPRATSAADTVAADARDAGDGAPVPMLDLEAAELLGLNQTWTGDYEDLGERRFIRALVPYNLTLYWLDRAEQRGAAFEALRELERMLPPVPGRAGPPPKIVIIPTHRDRLLPGLEAGFGDVAVGGFTITAERRRAVDFSLPTDVEIVHVPVTGPGRPPARDEADLAGWEFHVRTGSTYQDDLVALNRRLVGRGLAPVIIRASDDLLEDEDVLQLVDAGIVPATLMRRHLAHFWSGHFTRLQVHDSVALRTHSEAGWAVRKGTPQLLAIVNDFVATHRAGTFFGNVIRRRYFGSVSRLRNPGEPAARARFESLADLFRRYGERYDLEWRLLLAQGYQESHLDQARTNPSGAVGIMQIKPSTAADRAVGIADVSTAEANIHAGAKYLRYLIDQYFADSAITRLDQTLFALAAYNAGPGRIHQLRGRTAAAGLDPDVWFNNVEVAAAHAIGRETVDYVSNIYKYFTAYKAIAAGADREAAPVRGGGDTRRPPGP